MAAKSELDRATIFAGIEQLIGEGEYPTWTTLRKQLGDRGSPAMLQRYMREWYREHGPALRVKVDARKAARGDRSIGEHLEAATREALARFNAEQAERVAMLDARATALDQREADLLVREQRLDQRESAQAGWIADLQVRLDEAKQAREAAESQLLDLARQLSASHMEGTIRAEALARAHEDLASVRAASETASRAQVAAEARSTELANQMEKIREQLADTKRAQEAIRADLAQQQALHRDAAADWRAERTRTAQQLQEAEAKLQRAYAEASEFAVLRVAFEEREHSLKEQLQALNRTLSSTEARLHDQVSSSANLQAQFGHLLEERDRLIAQLDRQLEVVDRLTRHLEPTNGLKQ